MKNNKMTKKQYQKPAVARFRLKAEEAVLGFCKSSGSGGPSLGSCMDPISTVCKIQGS